MSDTDLEVLPENGVSELLEVTGGSDLILLDPAPVADAVPDRVSVLLEPDLMVPDIGSEGLDEAPEVPVPFPDGGVIISLLEPGVAVLSWDAEVVVPLSVGVVCEVGGPILSHFPVASNGSHFPPTSLRRLNASV